MRGGEPGSSLGCPLVASASHNMVITPLTAVPSHRAMTECNSAQIPGIFGEAALILSSEEDELKKVTALALVIEVRTCLRVGGGSLVLKPPSKVELCG